MYSEDSELLGKYLITLEGSGSFLEIGVGGGSNLSSVDRGRRFERIVGTDLLPLSSIRQELPRSIELAVTDRASCFRASTFDVIAFNPPYVPSGKIEDITTDGGLGGVEVPLQFLSSALSVLKPEGKIVMLLSSDDTIADLQQFCEKESLHFSKVAESELFFESLFVYLITREKKVD